MLAREARLVFRSQRGRDRSDLDGSDDSSPGDRGVALPMELVAPYAGRHTRGTLYALARQIELIYVALGLPTLPQIAGDWR